MIAHTEAVEAAVEAGYTRMRDGLPSGAIPILHWDELPPVIKAKFIETFQFQNAAYLRHLRAAGYVVTRVPDALGPDFYVPTDDWAFYNKGWNTARAEMLANAVEVGE